MNLYELLSDLEENDELHEARLILLLRAFAGDAGDEAVEGLTKLAKLDFLLRLPHVSRASVGKKARGEACQSGRQGARATERGIVDGALQVRSLGSPLPSIPESVGREGACEGEYRGPQNQHRSDRTRHRQLPTG